MSESTQVTAADIGLGQTPSVLTTPTTSLPDQASAALTKLARIITHEKQCAELLGWLPDIADCPLAKLSHTTKTSFRTRLGRFFGNLWLTGLGKESALVRTGDKQIRMDSIPIVAEPIAGCPALLSLASASSSAAIPDDHEPGPLCALIDKEWQRAVARFSL